ncbi:MAG: phosphopentomutase [Clostridia bacterium]|nr:phosphopentomutase [Clostridia bacterium]
MDVKKVVLIILDSLGVGALPDADKYGDEGSNTLLHVAQAVGGLNIPNLEKLGLGKIIEVPNLKKDIAARGAFGKMKEQSAGKDTTTGHWEIMGIIMDKPFPTYPNGFPDEVIQPFEKRIGKKVLGNKVASGTKIIEELGKIHIETGRPIVYTSADSVFQIAAHEEVIPVEKLYEYCEIAREILKGPHAVGRVIARPFVGEPGNFKRTANRHDFSLSPIKTTVLDLIKKKKLSVTGIGKIGDIFAKRGLTEIIHTKNNMDGVDKTIVTMKKQQQGLIFTNLVDYDQRYGHRNDPEGYAKAIKDFDERLPEIIESLHDNDVLIISADHGCDPTTDSTDHSREYVPLMIYGNPIKSDVDVGVRETFADLGATIADLLKCEYPASGTSMVEQILRRQE